MKKHILRGETIRAAIASMLVGWARQGAEISNGKHGKMCETCAFRPGTEANADAIVIDAANLVAGCPGQFHCHENKDQKCVGYLYALEIEKMASKKQKSFHEKED